MGSRAPRRPLLWGAEIHGPVDRHEPLSAPLRRYPMRDGTVVRMTAAIARGDSEAFDRLYAGYAERVRRYLLVLSGGREERTHEAFQDAMIRVARHLPELPTEAALWRWLARAARSALIDRVRRGLTRRAAHAVLREIRARRMQAAPDPILYRELERALGRLEPVARQLVEAHYLKGESQQVLAERWGLTRKAVESRLLRARRTLREDMLRGLRDG